MRLNFSIAVTSVAVIAFQIAVMQILSITQWHHFAWMVISMAMLGFGAAGTFLFLFREPLVKRFAAVFPVLLFLGAGAMSAAVPLTGLTVSFDPFLLFFERRQIFLLLGTYLLFALPFFFSGLAITLAFYHAVDRIGTVYFFNLSGSATGAIAGILILYLAPAEYVALVPAVLLIIAGFAVLSAPRGRTVIIAAIFAGVALATNILVPVPPKPSEYKDISAALQLPGAQVIYRSFSPFGRLELVRAEALRYDPGLSLQHREEPPVRDILFNNGSYFGTMLGFDPEEKTHILDNTTRSLPYIVRTPRRVAVLGATTGPDISHALSRDAHAVTAVESHREATRLLTEFHPEWNDNLYLHPAVTIESGTIRQFLGRFDNHSLDHIVIPVLGRFGGTSGVDALEEQYHLTREAFEEMYRRLRPGGTITATVWLDDPPRPSLRLLDTWRAVLQREGVAERSRHIIAVRSWTTATFVMSNTPFTDNEVSRVRKAAAELGFDPLILPEIRNAERTRFNRLADDTYFTIVDLILEDQTDTVVETYPFTVRAVEDRRPYFYHFLRLSKLAELREAYGSRALPYMELGFFLALAAAFQAIIAAFILIVLPLAGRRWTGKNRAATFFFFFGTGAGFMVFEIALIQQAILYLGLPVYATAAVLTILLLSSGLGSFVSTGLKPAKRTLSGLGSAIALLIVVVSSVLQPILHATINAPLVARVLVTVAVTVPPGFLMGILFPLGLRRLSATRSEHIPWACAIDSCLAVSVTAPATLGALAFGLDSVMLVAAGAYMCVAAASLRLGGASALEIRNAR